MEETRFAFKVEFPEANGKPSLLYYSLLKSQFLANLSCTISKTDWTPVVIHDVVLHLVARISGRVFVGLPFCRNDEWLVTSVKFTEDAFSGAITVSLLPRFLRFFASTFILPYARRIAKHKAIARKYLAPVYAERLAQELGAGDREKPKVEDIYTWMLGQAKPELKTAEKLADFQLLLSMAALHTTTITLVAVLYDIAARPEYIESLREEMISMIQEDGGMLKKTTLTKMVKLDSFMKESMRFNSSQRSCPCYTLVTCPQELTFLLVAFVRKVLQPMTLSDGTHLPHGTMIGAPLHAMMHDPALVENPDVFDGYRWYKLRQKEGQFNSHQFVSTSASTLLFGHGNHACPGRFFAANEIQFLLVTFLLRYDFKYPEGETRPANWSMAENVLQNTKRVLVFKKRQNQPPFTFL